nr:alpha/beta fold hydrolase [Kineosporia babensis]
MRREGRDDRPLVVLEAGLGASRSYWARVQDELAGKFTTVAYDRSGLGRSPAAQGARGLNDLAADLNAFLDQLLPPGERVILAGHSWGGPITRVATAANPGRVAGLLLVDPTDEACDLYFSPPARRLEKIMPVLSRLMTSTGLNRLTARGVLALMPDDAAADMHREAFTRGTAATYRAELAHLSRDLFALKQQPPSLKGVSLTVISAGQTSPGINTERLAALQLAHRVRAGQDGGRHVFAGRSGHLVPLDDPATVAGELRKLLDHNVSH